MGFRFQFENAIVALENDELTIYDCEGNRIKPCKNDGSAENQSDFELPSSDGYANEIRYFADCVKAGREADMVKPNELETVIDILKAI